MTPPWPRVISMPPDIGSLIGRRPGGGGAAVRGTPPALVLRADTMAVRDALAVLVDQLGSEGMGLEELGAVELVLAETLNNIVEHAYGGHDAGEIQLWWTFGTGSVHFRIADSGAAMPLGKLPLCDSAKAIDHAALVPEGGFGWFLITGLARNIIYRRERGYNVLTFRMVVGESV